MKGLKRIWTGGMAPNNVPAIFKGLEFFCLNFYLAQIVVKKIGSTIAE